MPHWMVPSVLLVSLLATACGSNVSPETVNRLQTGGVPGNPLPGSMPTTSNPAPTDAATASRPDATTSAEPGAGSTRQDGPGKNTNANDVDCVGFRNQVGITDDTITVANVSDVSGPVPGIFEIAQQSVAAYFAYFNSEHSICGRKLKLLPLDTRTDSGGDQQGYAVACSNAFAAVGSMSGFDSGGALEAQECGIPDLRALTTTDARLACRTCFATYSVEGNLIATSLMDFWKKREPVATQHIGILYADVDTARVQAESFMKAWEHFGMKVPSYQAVPVAEFNYAPYVQNLKDSGVQFVQYFGPYQFVIRLRQAMVQQHYSPKVYLEDPTIYDEEFVKRANGLAEGSFVFSATGLFDDKSIPEMALYQQWLAQIDPGATPNYYGLFAWSAARLFVEQAAHLGGQLSRESLLAAIAKVTHWTDNGAHAPMDVGPKTTSPCLNIIELRGDQWHKVSPGRYMCADLYETGVK